MKRRKMRTLGAFFLLIRFAVRPKAEYTACWRSAQPTTSGRQRFVYKPREMPLPNHIRKDLGHVADMFMIDVMVPTAPGKFSSLSNKTREPTKL